MNFSLSNAGEAKFLNLSLKEKLLLIPENERLVLEHFFQILIKSEGLGYTLFGSKPVSLSAYFGSVPFGNLFKGCNSNIIKMGWKVWGKYEKIFPHPKYLIFEESAIVDDTEICTIVFINKEKMINTLKQHQRLFSRELNFDIDPEAFLLEIEEKKSLEKTLKQHEGLLGILLGYGEKSSMNYHLRNLAWKFGLPIGYDESDFQAVSLISQPITPFCLDIQPIHFAGNPQSDEVQAISKQNQKERAQLLDLFSSGKFLEISLRKLMDS